MDSAPPLTAPVPVELPAPKSGEYLSEAQWQILLSLIDGAMPSITVEEEPAGVGSDQDNHLRISETRYKELYASTESLMQHPPSPDAFKEYIAARALDNKAFVDQVKRTVGNLPAHAMGQLRGILSMLATRLGSFAATGYTTPVYEQPVHVREEIIRSWQASWLPLWPALARSVLTLARVSWALTDQHLHRINDFAPHPSYYKPGPSFDFEFMQFGDAADSEPAVVDSDVVIVGSGCGGAVCAKVLAEAGHSVVVVDKGYHFPTENLPMPANVGICHLYEGNGIMQTKDNSMSVLAGGCWGGGGTINWSVSLQPQGYVRQEWADKGLDFFITNEFQKCLDRVCDFMGVSDANIRHPNGSRVILEGSRRLGWHAKPCPVNSGGAEHNCGRCGLGCGSAEKQGPAVSWLPAAARAGARFIEGFNVSKVLFDEGSGGSNRAVGVQGLWTSRDKLGSVSSPQTERTQRQVRIKAKKVIVACGTLHSPLLLTRSGLKNPHIGQHLKLHPVGFVNAAFDYDVKAWEDPIITSVCTSFENLDGNGHGVKIETTMMMPHMIFFGHPWRNALQFKLDALRYRQMNAFISVARDRDEGRVYADPDGVPILDYTPSAHDRASILAGLVATAKLCYIQGAREIWAFIDGMPPFVRKGPPPTAAAECSDNDGDIDQGINDPDFTAWLRQLERVDNAPAAGGVFSSAHQMGTCRMSARAADGVVDPRGRVWGATDLYVADASVFPSASGVNPMITNMAIADWIARGVDKELRGLSPK